MISDLPGDIGPLDPGVDELFRTLTSGPTPAELAGEQSALAMFRANISPPASPATAPVNAGRSAGASKPSVGRMFRRSGGWGIRLAAAVVIVLAVALASAAYTAVLPQPIQLLAHRVLGALACRARIVPATLVARRAAVITSRRRSPAARRATLRPGARRPRARPARPRTSPPRQARPRRRRRHRRRRSPPARRSCRHPPAAPRSSAGSQVVIDGQFTRSGTGVQGVTVQLIERFVGHPFWHLAGTAQTTTGGNVAVTVPAVPANAVFRLRDYRHRAQRQRAGDRDAAGDGDAHARRLRFAGRADGHHAVRAPRQCGPAGGSDWPRWLDVPAAAAAECRREDRSSSSAASA